MRVDDARRALACGVDGVVVSNHGGKVLESTPATLDVLPAIADAAGDRRGADVVKARALGASGVLIGRPYLWGLACAGEAGVAQVLRLFRQSLSATLSNLDLDRVEAVDCSVLAGLTPDPSARGCA
jgi:isopentenyl diphosphate isomerase/L-lactate dehydrogenase-like FMN-dependent dehydrogenase